MKSRINLSTPTLLYFNKDTVTAHAQRFPSCLARRAVGCQYWRQCCWRALRHRHVAGHLMPLLKDVQTRETMTQHEYPNPSEYHEEGPQNPENV